MVNSVLFLFGAAFVLLFYNALIDGNVIRVHSTTHLDKKGNCKQVVEISADNDLLVETYTKPCDPDALDKEVGEHESVKKDAVEEHGGIIGEFVDHPGPGSRQKKASVRVKSLKEYCNQMPELCFLYYMTKELFEE